MVNLEAVEYRIIRQFAEEKGLSRKGFSAALRIIVRDWYSLRIFRQTQNQLQERAEANTRLRSRFPSNLLENGSFRKLKG